MAIQGTTYTNKEELLRIGVEGKIYKNGENVVDALAVQQAFGDTVESLWSLVGAKGLLEVLTTNSVAETPTDVVITKGPMTYVIGDEFSVTKSQVAPVYETLEFKATVDNLNYLGQRIESGETIKLNSSLSKFLASGEKTGVNATNYYCLIDPDGVHINTSIGSNNTITYIKDGDVRIEADNGIYSSGVTLGEDSDGDPNTMSIFVATDQSGRYHLRGSSYTGLGGVTTASSLESTTPPTATWDIDGTARIRTIGDGSADANMLTVDDDGNVHKTNVTAGSSSIQVFTESSDYMSTVVTRYVSGLDFTLHVKTTYLNAVSTNGENHQDSLTINNIVPLDFMGMSWMKILTITTTVDSITKYGRFEGDVEDRTGEFGQMVLNDLSTYENGIQSSADFTRLHLAGAEVGVGRAFLVDPTYSGSDFDRDEGSNGTSGIDYIHSSPKDIRVSALSMTIENGPMAFGIYQNCPIGTYVTVIKGTLE